MFPPQSGVMLLASEARNGHLNAMPLVLNMGQVLSNVSPFCGSSPEVGTETAGIGPYVKTSGSADLRPALALSQVAE